VKQEKVLKLSETEIVKLPFLTKAAYVHFRKTKSMSYNYIYAKHGEAFATNLFALLNDLRTGKIEEIWYNTDRFSEVRISKEGSFITGVFCSSNQESLKDFESKLAISRKK
jgi:hypothetical protein